VARARGQVVTVSPGRQWSTRWERNSRIPTIGDDVLLEPRRDELSLSSAFEVPQMPRHVPDSAAFQSTLGLCVIYESVLSYLFPRKDELFSYLALSCHKATPNILAPQIRRVFRAHRGPYNFTYLLTMAQYVQLDVRWIKVKFKVKVYLLTKRDELSLFLALWWRASSAVGFHFFPSTWWRHWSYLVMITSHHQHHYHLITTPCCVFLLRF